MSCEGSESLSAALLVTSPKLLAPRRPHDGRLVGYLALGLLLCSQVGQAEVAQYIQTTLRFNKPYMVTWINHSTMALLVPANWRNGTREKLETVFGMRMRHIIALMAMLALVYTFGDYAWYLALPYTTVTEATALFNSQSVWAYFFSVLLLGEEVRTLKVVALLLSVGGIVVITTWADSGSDGHSVAANGTVPSMPPASPPSPAPPSNGFRGSRLVGDAFALGAAMAYALYEVLYKRGLGDGGSDDARLVNVATGLVGVCSIVIAAPGFPVLDSLGVEPFELPPSVTVTLWLALNASLALVYNASFMMSVARLSPLITSVGFMLTIPMASVVDVLWHHAPLTWADAGGGVLIVAGFGLLFSSDARWTKARGSPSGAAAHAAALETQTVGTR